tara:strand:+ start:548 stop:955 length:408 start_codon:yes stop_codon:yes gene_type:complete
MNKTELRNFYKLHNLTPDDVYKDKRGFVIITRNGVEKIQNQNNIKVGFEVIVCDLENVVLKAVSMRFDSVADEFVPIIETFGSASINNCRQHFLVEIAEKRALARCIIKTMKFTGFYGEDEMQHQPNESLNKFKK